MNVPAIRGDVFVCTIPGCGAVVPWWARGDHLFGTHGLSWEERGERDDDPDDPDKKGEADDDA